jgi:hypothetical protein
MKCSVPGLVLSIVAFAPVSAVAQTLAAEQEVIQLSKNKWQWMADKAVDKLGPLFHDNSKFVHMGGTWKKTQELDIIKAGSIWYKQTDVHDVTAEIFQNTAIVWSRITLHAVVGGKDVVNEFTATEVYQRDAAEWKLLDLTFSSVTSSHKIQK